MFHTYKKGKNGTLYTVINDVKMKFVWWNIAFREALITILFINFIGGLLHKIYFYTTFSVNFDAIIYSIYNNDLKWKCNVVL